ncbi:hypothetical protein, partial [Phocaeicola vulgatus]|uniref:hypothetical protein n=2 Tax=Phocaeicola vulgatus TaxID=821 RepID=UPI0034A23677
CVTKHVFITEDTGGKRHTHYNIRTRAYKDGKKEGAHTKTADGKQGKTEKKQIRRTTGHRKLGQGKEWTGKQLRKTQYDIHNTHK